MIIIFCFFFGLIIGSFLNVLIYRIPRGESIVLPPSHCPKCGSKLRPSDLVPVISYLWLRGRCRYCDAKIGWRYLVVEVISGLLTLIWWFKYGLTPQGAALLVLSYALIAIAFIDMEHRIIPNRITMPLIIGGLAFQLLQGELVSAIIGGLVGGGILLIIALLYPGGMGYGDVKLLAMVGVFLGWEKALLTLFFGSAFGAIIMTPLLVLKKINRKTPFPFGPFLVAASLIAIFWWEGAQWLLYWRT